MSPPWMPLYIADYLADTTHLDAMESGAYLHLIMQYWQNGGSLPDDDKQLARIARMTAGQWRGAKPVLQAFFHDGWKHARIDKELAHAADVIAKRKAAVAERENKRRSSDASNDRSNDASHDDTRARASPSPEPIEKEDTSLRDAAVAAPVQQPVYTDSKHALWGEGVAILRQLGVKEAAARSNIGRWMRSAKDDPVVVLSAIQRAGDQRVIDPIPWVTRAIATAPQSTGPPRNESEKERGQREWREARNDLSASIGRAGADRGGSDHGLLPEAAGQRPARISHRAAGGADELFPPDGRAFD